MLSIKISSDREYVDAGQGDGSAHTEGLEARHPGDGPHTEGEDVGQAGHGDGDTGVLGDKVMYRIY